MKERQELLEKLLGLKLSKGKTEMVEKYMAFFLEKNAHTNLISKNDEKFLFEKHVFDSFAINKFFQTVKKVQGADLLDIGTGGGFPSVPVSIAYDDINVYAVDSIRKKIAIIEEIKVELGLKNLFPICQRVEKLNDVGDVMVPKEFDYITTRAVAQMDAVLKYAMPILKPGGYFIAYKSKKALEELKGAEKTLKQFNAKVHTIIEYQLPLEEAHERNLIVVKKGEKK